MRPGWLSTQELNRGGEKFTQLNRASLIGLKSKLCVTFLTEFLPNDYKMVFLAVDETKLEMNEILPTAIK